MVGCRGGKRITYTLLGSPVGCENKIKRRQKKKTMNIYFSLPDRKASLLNEDQEC
jgi:hypothetical protein